MYLPFLRQAFDIIADGTNLVIRQDTLGPLSVTMLATFAIRWFIPRWREFHRMHPDVEVRIVTTDRMVDFFREDIDCGIRCGTGSWPGLDAVKLFEDRDAAVYSPDLLTGALPLAAPDDLRHHTLLHEQDDEDWRCWLAVLRVDDTQGLIFKSGERGLEAAVAGSGVAPGSRTVVQTDVDHGRLVMAFGDLTDEDLSRWLVHSRGQCPKTTCRRLSRLAGRGGVVGGDAQAGCDRCGRAYHEAFGQ